MRISGLTILIFIALGCLGYSSWTFYQEYKSTDVKGNPLEYLPTSPNFVGRINDIPSFLEALKNNKALEELVSLNEEAQWLLPLIDNNPELKSIVASSLIFSAYPQADGTSPMIWSLSIPEHWSIEQVSSSLEKQLAGFAKESGPNRFTISGPLKGYILYQKGVLHYSRSENVLEILTPKEDNPTFLINDSGFLNKWKSLGKADANFCINHQSSDPILSSKIKAFSAIHQFAEWSTLDVFIKNHSVEFSGISSSGVNKEIYLNGIGAINKMPQLKEVLPLELTELLIVGRPSKDNYIQYLKSRLDKADLLDEYNASMAEAETKCECDLEDKLWDWTGDVLAYANGRFNNENSDFLIFGMADTSIFNHSILALTSPKRSRFKGYRIWEWDKSDWYKQMLGPPFDVEVSACCVIDDYVVFGENITSLKAWIRSLVGSPLRYDFAQKDLSDQSILLEFSTSQLLDEISQGADSDWASFVTTHKSAIDSLTNKMSFIVSKGNKDLAYLQGSILRQGYTDTENFLEWEFNVSAPIMSGLSSITNHRTKKDYILFQDAKHSLNAVDCNGKPMWKTDIGSPILSELIEVDLFKNGKIQFAFNTKDKIFCLDALGNIVEGFPIELPSKASSELAIFDYDNNKKYRFVIGLEDGSVMNYKKDGKNTSGWKFKANPDKTITFLQHIKAGNKDYIAAIEKEGNVLFLKRNGKSRYDATLSTSEIKSKPKFRLKSQIEASSILYLDNKSELIELQIGNGLHKGLSGLTQSEYFELTQIDGNRGDELLIGDGNRVAAYTLDKNILFDLTFPANISESPKVKKVGAKYYVFTVCDNNQIYVSDVNGEMKASFPVLGSEHVIVDDFDRDGQVEIITLSNDREIICYEMAN